MMKNKKYIPVILLLAFASCRSLNPNILFQTDKAAYSSDSTARNVEYLLAPHDRLDMHVYSNDGFKLVDVTQASSTGTNSESVNYTVEEDGNVKLPVLGKTMLRGLTLRQAERLLEEKYAKYYLDPFIQLRVINRHAIVFSGEDGAGTIVEIKNDNTTLIEAIALAGGVTGTGKAYKIKVIRGDIHNPKVYLIDLSTIEGMKKADLTVQSNDIIYIESKPQYSTKVLTQITPVVGILTSILLILNLFYKK